MYAIYLFFILFFTCAANSAGAANSADGTNATGVPATEVRAVWLTTNYGLDWPRNRTSHEAQKQELIEILDNLQKFHFNTVMFQVRARGEVLYRSVLEPMSSLIIPAGPGQPPFDPLAFAIEECHKRGMEIHAWMVTYPLGAERHVRSLGQRSIIRKQTSLTKRFQGEWFLDPRNPRTDDYLIALVMEVVEIYAWMVTYPSWAERHVRSLGQRSITLKAPFLTKRFQGEWFLDPGNPSTVDHRIALVMEVVENYDVDGIHFDYLRYPDNRGR